MDIYNKIHVYIHRILKKQMLGGGVSKLPLTQTSCHAATSGVGGLGRFGSECAYSPSAHSNINNAPGF